VIQGPSSDDTRSFLSSIDLMLDPELRFEAPVLTLALETWNRLRGDRAMPSPADIDPLTLPRALLPHILLIDVEHEPALRFRWRLIGTHITNVTGRDSTGRYWDEIYDRQIFGKLKTGPLWIMKHRRPVRTFGSAYYVSKDFIGSESVDLPLSVDGSTVSRVMVVTQYTLD